MVILESENELTLINPVRMTADGLSRLDELGDVKYILRLGDLHGLDDAFYLDRYGCEFWAQDGQSTYKTPIPTRIISSATESPFPNSEFFVFESARYPEAALLLKDRRILITTDSVQYHSDWSYFSWLTQFAFKILGFKIGLNIGPPWLARATPNGRTLKEEFDRLLALDFDSIIGAHGLQLEFGAKQALDAEVRRVWG